MKNIKHLPEEKLLQLIKGGKHRAGEPAAGSSGPLFPDMVISQSAHPLQFRFSLSHVRLCAAVVVGVAAVLVAKNLLVPMKIEEEPQVASAFNGGDKTLALEPVITLDSYLADSSAQSFFRPQSSALQAGAAGSELVQLDLAKDLNLMGIISGENPQAVVEDKKGQQTYYLAKGQFINEMQVVDIQDNRVVLEYKGKRVELHL